MSVPKISLGVLVMVLVAGAFVVGFGREYLRNREIENEISGLQAENTRLEGKKLGFVDLIQNLSSQYYLEDQARVKEGLAKPGETLVLVNGADASNSTTGKVLGATDAADGIANPTKWLYFFFDHAKYEQLQTDL